MKSIDKLDDKSQTNDPIITGSGSISTSQDSNQLILRKLAKGDDVSRQASEPSSNKKVKSKKKKKTKTN